MISLEELLELTARRTETIFEHYLTKNADKAPTLQNAMRYSVMNGGKRIRPLLVYATGLGLGASVENLDAPACAIELIHSYSLIHDDLPSMDNADLRRGQPSCHKAFGETLAILAGDALQPLAFELLASHPSALTDQKRLMMIQSMSQACGMNGMVAGQVLDMENPSSQDQLEKVHHLKTGALISSSIMCGYLASDSRDQSIKKNLMNYATLLGLGFQIQDDLLDLTGKSETTGKMQGIDVNNKKTTFATGFDISTVQHNIDRLFVQAEQQLNELGDKGKILKDVTEYIFQRKK